MTQSRILRVRSHRAPTVHVGALSEDQQSTAKWALAISAAVGVAGWFVVRTSI